MTAPTAPASRSLPRRDRIAIVSALAGITVLAWIHLAIMAVDMQTQPMSESVWMVMGPWTPVDFAMMFSMWAVMMVGMMVPTAIPMTLLYAAVARKAARQGAVLAPTANFVAGYVAMWTLFSVGATAAQWGLDRAALISPMGVSTSPILGGLLLVVAGIYQLTPIKDACLRHCRSPAHFISEHWRTGAIGAFRMGLVHGAFCLGCCWVLMGLLFLGGAMNLLWIAAITAFVLIEKLMPHGALGARFAGGGMIAAGAVVLVMAMSG